MKIPFEDDFKNLPDMVREPLIKQLEDAVYLIRNRYNMTLRDHDACEHSARQVAATIYSIFNLIDELKLKDVPDQDIH